jgi:hypothetical protein
MKCWIISTSLTLKALIFNKIQGHVQYIFNILKTKLNLFYTRNQSVPRSKHFPQRL